MNELSTRSQADDLIVARATAAGPGAIAILRLDGQGAAEATARLFQPLKGAGPIQRPRHMVHGRWVDPATGEPVDEGLCVFFSAPHSYTGNDMAEFHCHGGPVCSRRLIEITLVLGARLATPGEFTRRAYLNGRMDLAQAEAVADLINAQTERAARAAQGQLAGALSQAVHALREELLDFAAQIEARIDFPEEDIDGEDRQRMELAFADSTQRLDRLLQTRRRGRLLREGARVALVGAPNAGKSSLLNALARIERAIVTPHPGTTRDTIECTVDLGGVPVTLVDTAGLRRSDDPIERIGIERARREIELADLVVLVRDATAAPGEASFSVERPPDLIALNKIDLAGGDESPLQEASGQPPCLPISATRGDGLDALEAALRERLLVETQDGADAVAVNLRHGELLDRASQNLSAAAEGFANGLSGELVMVDLREAIEALGEILGLEIGDAILDRIFSQFCLGK